LEDSSDFNEKEAIDCACQDNGEGSNPDTYDNNCEIKPFKEGHQA